MKSLILSLVIMLPMSLWASSEAINISNKKYSSWVNEMKSASRGPFKDVKWFCNDGSVLPPKAYACSKRGGGVQHGNYNDRTKTLRKNGYYIANFMAGIDAKKFINENNFNDRYNQILLEKFLTNIDDGWILRKATFYRGAIQAENEGDGAREL
jgi:hypothetical protein